jgi:hypothetical protein
VAIGWTNAGWTEIRDGLQAGDRVIVDGYQVLQPGDAIVCDDAGSTPAASGSITQIRMDDR